MTTRRCNHERAKATIESFVAAVPRVYPSTWSPEGTIHFGGFCRVCGIGLEATFDSEGRPVPSERQPHR